MIAYYAQVKWMHIAAVIVSGGLFALRGALVQAGRAEFARLAPLRWLSWGIDTVLLTAALMLATMLPDGFFANGWLLAKIVLLVVYIGLGTAAIKATRRARGAAAYAGALSVFALIVGIARAHHPLGWFAWIS